MPQVSRTRRIQETLQTSSKEGEIIIHLNLNISIDSSGTVQVDHNVPLAPQEEEKKKVEIIPTELFSQGDCLLENFGEPKKAP